MKQIRSVCELDYCMSQLTITKERHIYCRSWLDKTIITIVKVIMKIKTDRSMFLWTNDNNETSKISHEKTWTWLRKGDPKKQNKLQHKITPYHRLWESKINKTQQKSRCKLWGDREETINHIITQKEYKTKHESVGKCKKFKVNYTNKWYMHKQVLCSG